MDRWRYIEKDMQTCRHVEYRQIAIYIQREISIHSGRNIDRDVNIESDRNIDSNLEIQIVIYKYRQ